MPGPQKGKVSPFQPIDFKAFMCLNLGTFRQIFGEQNLVPPPFFSIQKTQRHKKNGAKGVSSWHGPKPRPQTSALWNFDQFKFLPTLGCQTLCLPNLEGCGAKATSFWRKKQVKKTFLLDNIIHLYIYIYIYTRIYKMLKGILWPKWCSPLPTCQDGATHF